MTGFAIGAFFSLMSASFAYEDPLMRQSLTTAQKTSEIFREMGRNMWRSGKGFGKVGVRGDLGDLAVIGSIGDRVGGG